MTEECFSLQAESAEQSQTGNGIVAGDDAELASVPYPLDLHEALDLCIDVTVRRSDALCHVVLSVDQLQSQLS